jgi:hypothetical protein
MMTMTTIRSLFLALVWLYWLQDPVLADSEDSCADPSAEISDCKASDVFLVKGVPPTRDSTEEKWSLLQGEPSSFHKASPPDEIPPGYVHIAANGDHEGWLVHLPVVDQCHVQLATRLIAREIVALYDYDDDKIQQVDLRGPHRLVDDEGRPFDSSNATLLHLLLPREAFIHKAVSEGHVRTLSDGKTTLTTLSLSPRVFLVDPIISQPDCQELIDIGSKNLHRSSERHYSDEYKDYRTSLSGSTPRNAPVTKRLWERVKYITAMPDPGVESPQLLKYETNTSWYKAHHDFFHQFEGKPLEEVRMFVVTRAHELLQNNVTIPEELSSVLQIYVDTLKKRNYRFDPDMAATIAVKKGLVTGDNGHNENHRLLLHDFIMISEDPIQEFSNIALLYASELLANAEIDNPMTTAVKYFQLEGVANPNDNTGVLPYYYLPDDYVPYLVKPIQNNRHATVLPILQAADRGGHTAFPLASSSRKSVSPDPDELFQECTEGLIVKATAGQALLFYNRLPRGDLDYTSKHAGCPCHEGEKFAVNCFTWDSDPTWAFQFLTDVKELYQ